MSNDVPICSIQSKRREMRDRRQDDGRAPTSRSSPNRPEKAGQSQNLPSPESTSMSLAYSVDDSTYFRAPAANVNNENESVMTMGTENQSLLSYVTRSTMVRQDGTQVNVEGDDDDDISLSILESKSSLVPNDDELMAIGWAKALDPNSGSYYYFTLDRSKTVWDNPLSP